MKDKVDQCSDAARHAISRSRLAADTRVRREWLEIADAWESLSNGWTELWRVQPEVKAPPVVPQESAAGT